MSAYLKWMFTCVNKQLNNNLKQIAIFSSIFIKNNNLIDFNN